MAEGVRPERVAEAFKEVLASAISELKDPRVGFVTVTDVDVSPDLRNARVYYTVLGDESERKRTRAGLHSARKRLRSELGQHVRVKFLPEIEFIEDDAVRRGERVERILRELRSEQE